MEFINNDHKALIERMFNHYGFAENPETMTTKEIVELLFTKVKRVGVDKLLEYLASHDYYTAPASTKFHGNYAGALASHSINVCALLTDLNEKYQGGLFDETVILSALMHDLCKVDFYTKEFRNQKVYKENGKKSDAGGRFDWEAVEVYTVEDKMPLGHGEKSLYMLQGFIKVTREEAFLIRWHMGPFSSANEYDFNNAVQYQHSVALMYTADFLASSLYEITVK